jgi:hypothetical protein
MVWQQRHHQYDAEFQKFMDRIFTEGKGQPLYPELATDDG